jgi:Fe-S cluster assembly iron-binding protein IscA
VNTIEVIIKPSARAQLTTIPLQDDKAIRIQATFIGSCSIFVEYHLSISKKEEKDELFNIEGIPVVISKEAQKYLTERVILDYNPNLGYKLSSNEETYRYNLQLKNE